MTTSRHRQIAASLATSLAGGSFSQAFATPAAKAIQLADLPEVQSLTVAVMPKGRTSKRQARGIWHDHYTIAVIVQAGCDVTDLDRIDELELLVEEITDFVDAAGRMAGAALNPETSLDPLFQSDWLGGEQSQFLAMPEFVYRLEREL